VAKELEGFVRVALAKMSGMHNNQQQLVIQQGDADIEQIRVNYLPKLVQKVEFGEYYRYNHALWSRSLQQSCQLVLLVVYLKEDRLATTADIQKCLGVPVGRNEHDHFHIPIEDYLHSCVSLINELSRFAINCVIQEDFTRPLQIAQFAVNVHAGFQLLDLKNDSLRKRFDGIKYDIKKLEEVVYNIKLRHLHSK
jgi:predicted translin family RNA/ssDNA-binding protein